MSNHIIVSILTTIIAIQSALILVGSITVLQKALHRCSIGLRIAFVIFPIAACIEFLDIFHTQECHISAILLNTATILVIFWLWNQRAMFRQMEQMMKNHDTGIIEYSFITEIKAIISCFAVWVLRRMKNEAEVRCTLCEKIV